MASPVENTIIDTVLVDPKPEAPELKPVPDPTPRTRRVWRQSFSLTGMILTTVLVSILGAGGSAGYYALSVLYENKLRDTWAILYLELENRGSRLQQRLENYTSLSPSNHATSSVLLLQNEGALQTLRGPFPAQLNVKDLKIASDPRERFHAVAFSGRHYLARLVSDATASAALKTTVAPGRYLILWEVDLASWFVDAFDDLDRNTVYLISKEGSVLFSNDPDITDKTFMRRPLVQKFVAAPIRQGQFEFSGTDGASYGFFYEVPETNIMMFVETSKRIALASVRETAIHYGIVLVFILLLVGLLLQFPLNSLTNPMRDLVRMAWEVGEGNFNVKPKTTGFGELNVLHQAFADMGANLNAREERIQLLLVEQQEKFRLADELAIAHSIQNNFLTNDPLPRDSGLEIAARYIPAKEVAGDWYGYFFDPKRGESVFVIADVSGHGAGSAMFTAIIASLFEESKSMNESFDPDSFCQRLHHLMQKLGKGQMHATLLITKYVVGSDEMILANAGHPFPLIVYPEENGIRAEPVALRSNYLGGADALNVAQTSIPLAPGTALLLYTDGLVEGRPDHKLYTERRLSKAAKLPLHQTVHTLVSRVHEDWVAFLEGESALDDLCLVAVRRIP